MFTINDIQNCKILLAMYLHLLNTYIYGLVHFLRGMDKKQLLFKFLKRNSRKKNISCVHIFMFIDLNSHMSY